MHVMLVICVIKQTWQVVGTFVQLRRYYTLTVV